MNANHLKTNDSKKSSFIKKKDRAKTDKKTWIKLWLTKKKTAVHAFKKLSSIRKDSKTQRLCGGSLSILPY